MGSWEWDRATKGGNATRVMGRRWPKTRSRRCLSSRFSGTGISQGTSRESTRPAVRVQNGSLSSSTSWKNPRRMDFKVATDVLGASRAIRSGKGPGD